MTTQTLQTRYGKHPDAKALQKLFFAGYYLSQRSFDGAGWHDRGDEQAYRIVRTKMDEIVLGGANGHD